MEDYHQSKSVSSCAPGGAVHAQQPELTVVVPTYNEVNNVGILLEKISTVLEGENWEIIFVDDDSPDGTSQRVRDLGKNNPRVRLIHRIGRIGLSSACIEGLLASTAPYAAIIDADLQHDERLLKNMLVRMREGALDLIVASRNKAEGSFGEMPAARVKISQFATQLTNWVIKVPLSDPMSGNFMVTRKLIDDVTPRLYGQGFKLLLDFIANSQQPLNIEELPYQMRARHKGESKLGLQVVVEYLLFLASNMFNRVIPYRFLKFCLIGTTGVAVHMFVLWIFHRIFNIDFLSSQVIAVYTAMTSNYFLNNRFTFSDNTRKGKYLWTGLASFVLICSAGAFIGVVLGEFLHSNSVTWWGAGIATTIAAAVWNFSVSSIFTWPGGRKKDT